jgi:hypothetical protein
LTPWRIINLPPANPRGLSHNSWCGTYTVAAALPAQVSGSQRSASLLLEKALRLVEFVQLECCCVEVKIVQSVKRYALI